MLDHEYFRDKMRKFRHNNPLSQKQWVYVVSINDKKYGFLKKSDINIERMNVNKYLHNKNIINMF